MVVNVSLFLFEKIFGLSLIDCRNKGMESFSIL